MQKGVNPATIRETVDKWDAGGTLWTVEMGGLGPGYEQAIQILVFEILRDYADVTPPAQGASADVWAKYFGDEFGEAAFKRADRAAGGYSGAMVAAAKSLAASVIKRGWDAVLEEGRDRTIQVSTFWPKTPAQASEESKDG